MNKVTFLITTYNRKSELLFSIQHLKDIIPQENWNCIICDDGSSDGTYEAIVEKFPEVDIVRNEKNKGLIYSRNRLLAHVKTEFAITIDDDAHFLSGNPIPAIIDYFEKHLECGLLSFRVYWGLQAPSQTSTTESPQRVRSFVGCAHVWRMKAWLEIEDYPEWFIFYGEEDFAAYHLFKKRWEVHYLPSVLVQHRVEVKSRKLYKDYAERLRRSLRSGWYLYFMFFPLFKIPFKLAYSIWIQFTRKVLKGDWKALKALILAGFDLFVTFPKLLANRNALSNVEYNNYHQLPASKIYWNPDENSRV